ncbi:phosphatase PAP2 family protein [Pontibacter ruber]|uniref:Phosphatase PAP2 family protein n=1 Tax=Pontibacter ruber TaxID=1343895 RepID=A0ABW5D0D6_9BACT|nr:phosphatase PAP2 family protein [Pontibacter ruber]
MKSISGFWLRMLALLSVRFVLLSLLFLVCLYLLGHLIYDVFAEGDTGFDTTMFALADRITSPGMTRAMRMVSSLASDDYLAVAPALVTLIFSFWKGLRWHGLQVLVISFTCTLINQLLKHLFARARPTGELQEVSGLSFPSGHAMIGGVFYGLLIYIVWLTVADKKRRWLLCIFLTLLILLIGFSRIYLRVHFATDVVAGYLMGLLWLMLSLYLLGRLEPYYQTWIKPDK